MWHDLSTSKPHSHWRSNVYGLDRWSSSDLSERGRDSNIRGYFIARLAPVTRRRTDGAIRRGPVPRRKVWFLSFESQTPSSHCLFWGGFVCLVFYSGKKNKRHDGIVEMELSSRRISFIAVLFSLCHESIQINIYRWMIFSSSPLLVVQCNTLETTQ